MSPLAAPLLLVLGLCGAPGDDPAPTFDEKIRGSRKIDGFLPLHWDDKEGRLRLEIPATGREFLYQTSLATGVGSNPVGLDRGKLGESRVVVFRRVGPRVLLVEPNQGYRANSDRDAERRAVEESFAQSVHWGFPIEAEEGGRLLVDATGFFLRDAQGVGDALRASQQGAYRLDRDRSVIDPDRLRGFPKNMEVETLLTFGTDGEPGPLVSRTTPDARSISLRQRHSFIQLPELGPGYTPRPADPRVGVFAIDFYDYGTPFDRPIERRWICRHRLTKKDPDAAVSEPVEPIVYYVDAGAPEPIRSALVEGASWWAAAFEAAGFRDAFRVRVLPDDADPMDLRYNVIQWVHRSTRGWSYGNTVIDPRTGEILKGRVTLDSLRARQDALIGSGLVQGPVGRDACAAAFGPAAEDLAPLDPEQPVNAMVLARIRQLSAHEVGHTLGFAHNFAASAGNRASVMDYPAPRVLIRNGRIDLSDAYARGVGAYDVLAVKYAYSPAPKDEREPAFLDALLRRGIADGLRFLSDADARPEGAAHPLANLWDDGADPVAGLRHEMEVRRIALEQFGPARLRDGQPMADLPRLFLPLYLHHRYQLTAALKSIGGVDYNHAVYKDGRPSPDKVAEVVPATRQREALRAVLETLQPGTLAVPSRLLAVLPPTNLDRATGTAEFFPAATAPAFDPIACATIAADLAIAGLTQPQRAARLVDQNARDPKVAGLAEVLDELVRATWRTPLPEDARLRLVGQAVRDVVLRRLIRLAGDDSASPGVRAIASEALSSLARGIESAEDAHARAAHAEIRRFLERPDAVNRPTPPPTTPQGDPIGG